MNYKLTIGIDASRANQDKKTGVEWYAWHIIEQLKKIIPDNIRVVLYVRENLKGNLARLPANWREKVLRWPPGRLWTQIRLSWEMWRNSPDVLFVPSHVAPLIHPRKTVVTIHDVAASLYPQSFNWFERWYTLWSASLAVKKLWRVIVPSQSVKNDILKLMKLLDVGKIKVIYHGYDNNYSQNVEETRLDEILKKYNIKRPFLLSLGRLEEKKNTKRIVQAFNKLSLELPAMDYHLVLAGSTGYGYEEAEKEINESPYKERIILSGWVEPKDISYIMKAAEVFVFPSLYEGFGLPVAEAMAAGTPTVVSNNSGLREIGGDACVYVNAEDAFDIARGIINILRNVELRRDNINKGRERVKFFSWEKCARETLDLLRSD